MGYDPASSERYWSAHFATAYIAFEVEEALDEKSAAIAAAIFAAAGWFSPGLRPIADSAKSEIKAPVIADTQRLRLLLAHPTELCRV